MNPHTETLSHFMPQWKLYMLLPLIQCLPKPQTDPCIQPLAHLISPKIHPQSCPEGNNRHQVYHPLIDHFQVWIKN